MRWFFLLLIVLNVFYAVWHQQQVPFVGKTLEPVALYSTQKDAIRLVSESGGERELHVPELAVMGAAVGDTCLVFGELQSEAEAQALEQRLLSLDVRAQMQEIDVAAGMDYWVYLAPLGSRSASLLQLKELQARQIDSYIIAEGELQNGISLGIFPNQSVAEKVVERARNVGFHPLLKELERSQRRFRVKILPEGRRLLDESFLARAERDFPGLQSRLMSCESIATPSGFE